MEWWMSFGQKGGFSLKQSWPPPFYKTCHFFSKRERINMVKLPPTISHDIIHFSGVFMEIALIILYENISMNQIHDFIN